MKPQQQDTEAKKHSAVYVQTPDGKEIDVPKTEPLPPGTEQQAQQTADNTPTQSSGEVKSGEAG